MSRGAGLDPDALAALEEERRFLLRSLEDLEREHAAGDLDDGDYATLRDDYTVRAAETIRAIEDHREAFDRAPERSRGRTLAAVAGVIVFAVVAGLVVAASVGSRQEGETSSGGITVSRTPTQRAQACIPKMQEMQTKGPKAAISCFQAVLKDDPRNVVALTWMAWTLEQASRNPAFDATDAASLQRSADQLIERAVEVDGRYSYARAFRAVLAYRRGNLADAKRYLDEFEANDPAADARAVIAQMGLADNIAKGLADGSASTTTAPATTAPGGGG